MRIPSILLPLFILPSLSLASQADQIIMPEVISNNDEIYVPQTTPQPTLADLLTIEPSASIFYSYARELEMSSILSDHTSKVTLFVPTNKAVMALSRRPHQGPETNVEIEMTEEQFHNRAKKNVENWISAHVVPEYPLSLDSNEHPTLLSRKSISFSPIPKAGGGHGPEWSRVLLDNGVKIIDKKEGLNGDMYIIDGTISVD